MDTDEECTFGYRGMLEYGPKGLSHALNHARENVECGGHHGAFTTAVVEVAHKDTIKAPAKFAKTYGSYNKSYDGMFHYVLFETLCASVIALDKEIIAAGRPRPLAVAPTEKTHLRYKLWIPLPYTDDWSDVPIRGAQFPANWRSRFLSKKVIVFIYTYYYYNLNISVNWFSFCAVLSFLHDYEHFDT